MTMHMDEKYEMYHVPRYPCVLLVEVKYDGYRARVPSDAVWDEMQETCHERMLVDLQPGLIVLQRALQLVRDSE